MEVAVKQEAEAESELPEVKVEEVLPDAEQSEQSEV